MYRNAQQQSIKTEITEDEPEEQVKAEGGKEAASPEQEVNTAVKNSSKESNDLTPITKAVDQAVAKPDNAENE